MAVAKAYSCHRRYTGDNRNATLYFTGTNGLTKSPTKVTAGRSPFTTVMKGAPTSYSETSGVQDKLQTMQPYDVTGTFAAFTSKPLAKRVNIVGIPRLTVHLNAPTFAQTQTADPATQLVLFAKIYDVARDGTLKLQHRLISPVRVAE